MIGNAVDIFDDAALLVGERLPLDELPLCGARTVTSFKVRIGVRLDALGQERRHDIV